ncbi:MAG: phytoene desaturase family protein [Promethearchaeota archaeon]
MSKKKCIIIGAGIAGLCAGSYLQMNGYETEIFESHNAPGGLCTSWKRKDYIFDGCIHSLGGTNPNYNTYNYWNELINMEEIKFKFWEVLCQYENVNGKKVKIYTDPDKLKTELISIAPEDEKFINDLIKAIKRFSTPKFSNLNKKPVELRNFRDNFLLLFKIAPYLRFLFQWRKSFKDMLKKCSNPLLKSALDQEFYYNFPSYFFPMSLAGLHDKNGGYPIGGSLVFAQLIEKKYLNLEGKIHYNSKVRKINVEDDQATGITLDNNEVHNADLVISAADGYDTIFNMLEEKYIDKKLRKFYKNQPVYPSAVIISLGVARSFENEPPGLDLALKKPIIVDDKTEVAKFFVLIYNFDPTLAPKGKTCIRVIMLTESFQYWNELRASNKEKYDQEKSRIANEIIKTLDKRFGNIRDKVEVIDVVTPATIKRYTNNWKGSIQGWIWLPGINPKMVKKTLPGLKRFYQIGQWVIPGGGITSALITARDLAQIICKKDKKEFQVNKINKIFKSDY